MLVAIMAVPIIAYVALTYNNSFSQSLIDSGVTNPDNYLNFFKNDDGSNVSAVSIISNLAWGLGYFGMPHILIRFMAVKSDSEIKKSRKIAIVWVIIHLPHLALSDLLQEVTLLKTLTLQQAKQYSSDLFSRSSPITE